MKYLVLCATLNLLLFANTVWSAGKSMVYFCSVVSRGAVYGRLAAPHNFPTEIDTKSCQIKIVSAGPVLSYSCTAKYKAMIRAFCFRCSQVINGHNCHSGKHVVLLANSDQLKTDATTPSSNTHIYRPKAVKSSAIRIPGTQKSILLYSLLTGAIVTYKTVPIVDSEIKNQLSVSHGTS